MKTFINCAAQGDLLLRRIDSIPTNAKLLEPREGNFILAHSETGHHHVVAERPNVKLYATNNRMVSYLQVLEAADAAETLLEHLRNYDKHETIRIPPGAYEIRRQREYVPGGWRQILD